MRLSSFSLPRRATVVGGAVIILGVLLAAAVGTLAASPSGAAALPASQAIDGFGLTVRPIPVGAPGAAVSQEAARTAAVDTAQAGNEISAQHGQIDAGPGRGLRTAWVFFFAGGDPSSVSWGPPGANAPIVDYTGVVVDDQTGEVLRLMHAVHH
jgi:hypothetical protein